MSIVTKFGDNGETSLFDGSRVSKADIRIEVVGTIDELNAHIGGLALNEIQRELFELGSIIANPNNNSTMTKQLARLEMQIKKIESILPPLKNFILPAGHELAQKAHIARAVCRRAERRLAALDHIPENALPYLNRLSDYLFLLARKINFEKKTKETTWSQL